MNYVEKGDADKKPAVAGKVRTGTADKERELLDLFKKEKRLTRAEAENAMGVSVSTARRFLQKLIQKGLVASKGIGKKAEYIFMDEDDD